MLGSELRRMAIGCELPGLGRAPLLAAVQPNGKGKRAAGS